MIIALLPTDLTMPRTMCCRQPTLMIQPRASITDSAPSLHRVVEHMSRLTENLKMMPGECCSTKFALPLSTTMRMQMTRLMNSLVALPDLLDLTVPKRSHITTSLVLQMPHTMLRERHPHRFDCQKFKSFLTTRRPCSCFSPIFQQHNLSTTRAILFQARQLLRNHISLRKLHHPSLNNTSPDNRHQYLPQAHRWLCLHTQLIAVQQGRRSRF